MAFLFTNNAASNLTSGITSSDTSITVTTSSGAIFPTITGNDYFMITLVGISGTPLEIVKCTARTGDTMTIVRAQEGTTASAFTGGDKVELRITAGEMNALVSGSARGGGTDQVFYENGTTVNYDYTVTANTNAASTGPITISTGITVTVPTTSTWIIN
jgi:hypothetical protein